ncbi:MAG: MGMT family protein [Treponema sp.]|jgi:methylated-DNA-protein-cysteine methyltransferase-like protein|nr:MGMT family protein [Treponema sp.]
MTETTALIIKLIKAIPKGKVLSYGMIARSAGLKNGARQVVRVLHSMSEKHGLPWHRVIRSDGSIALGSCRGRELQTAMLRHEGVEVSKEGKVGNEFFAH